MSDRRFSAAQRQALEDALFPDWTVDAACRGIELPGRVYRAAFFDEVGFRPDPDAYDWPEKTIQAMRTCAGCPVKAECLTYAFDVNPHPRQFGVFGGVPGRIREMLGFRQCRPCKGTGFLQRMAIGDRTLRWADYSDAFPADFKGFPCRDCNRTGKVPDENRLARCAEWAARYAAKRGWIAFHDEEEKLAT